MSAKITISCDNCDEEFYEYIEDDWKYSVDDFLPYGWTQIDHTDHYCPRCSAIVNKIKG